MGVISLELRWLPGVTPASVGGEGVLHETSVRWEMGFAEGQAVRACYIPISPSPCHYR